VALIVGVAGCVGVVVLWFMGKGKGKNNIGDELDDMYG
jgi:hypothetical protein